MRKLLLAVLIGLLFGWSFDLQAQDPRFTQFYSSPQKLNPAMTGVFDGQVRLSANYRDQWSSILGAVPYKTINVGFESKFGVLKDDFFSLGVNVLRDEAGDAAFNQTQGHLSLSFMKQVAGGRGYRYAQYLIAGVQVGAGQNGVDWSGIRFSTQFDGIDYNGNLNSGESLGEQSDVYTDINAGLMWYGVFDKNKSFYAGAAVNHVNTPDISFYNEAKESLYRRWVMHAGGEIPLITRQLSLLPGILYMRQGPSREINFGSNLRYTNKDWNEVALRVGSWMRFVKNVDQSGFSLGNESILMVAALEMSRFQIGLSYDVNLSTLTEISSSRGAFEVSFIYISAPKKRQQVLCPRF